MNNPGRTYRREVCGLTFAEEFEKLKRELAAAIRLLRLLRHRYDSDLRVGGLTQEIDAALAAAKENSK
jgi:hypothetical protein